MAVINFNPLPILESVSIPSLWIEVACSRLRAPASHERGRLARRPFQLGNVLGCHLHGVLRSFERFLEGHT